MPQAADSTPYSDTLDDLVTAIGEVETYINGVDTPASPAQLAFLAFLQGPFAAAMQSARNDANPT